MATLFVCMLAVPPLHAIEAPGWITRVFVSYGGKMGNAFGFEYQTGYAFAWNGAMLASVSFNPMVGLIGGGTRVEVEWGPTSTFVELSYLRLGPAGNDSFWGFSPGIGIEWVEGRSRKQNLYVELSGSLYFEQDVLERINERSTIPYVNPSLSLGIVGQ